MEWYKCSNVSKIRNTNVYVKRREEYEKICRENLLFPIVSFSSCVLCILTEQQQQQHSRERNSQQEIEVIEESGTGQRGEKEEFRERENKPTTFCSVNRRRREKVFLLFCPLQTPDYTTNLLNQISLAFVTLHCIRLFAFPVDMKTVAVMLLL